MIDKAQANRDKTKVWRLAFPEKAKAVRKNWLRKVRTFLEDTKSSGCKVCGEPHFACLDFHHRDPKEKKFNIGMQVGTYSLKKLRVEVAKCDVLCANCHRKLHAKEREKDK